MGFLGGDLKVVFCLFQLGFLCFFSEIAGGEGNPKFLANLIKLYQLLITGF